MEFGLSGANQVARWSQSSCEPTCRDSSNMSATGRKPCLRPTRELAPVSPSKLPFHVRVSGLPSNTWFPGPTRVNIPNGITTGSADFPGLTVVTDRPRYSVCNNRRHQASATMRPNNTVHAPVHAAGELNALYLLKAKLHYALLVADRSDAGRTPAASWNLAYRALSSSL